MKPLQFADAAVAAAFPRHIIFPPAVGSGAAKAVYRAEKDCEPRALKIVRYEMLDEPEPGDPSQEEHSIVIERVRREVDALKRISSPYVANVLDGPGEVQIGDTTHLYWEETFYDRGTLADMIAVTTAPRSPAEIAKLGFELLSGVKAIWELGDVVHRDIKPHNIAINEADSAVILDLGTAFFPELDELTKSSLASPGTQYYAAPEQYENRQSTIIDHRTDQFVVGIVLHEYATGKNPFRVPGMTPIQYAESLRSYTPTALSAVIPNPELVEIINRLLSGPQNRRYRSVDEPISRLEGIS